MKNLFCFLFALLLLHFSVSIVRGQSADPLTGRLEFGLPIWTVSSGDVSAPIGISYTGGNGIKVNDSEGSAGMGWNFSAGGGVYRQLRGLPDDFVGSYSGNPGDLRNGWLHGNIAKQVNNFNPNDVTNCSSVLGNYPVLSNFNSIDTEPDVFSFNAPGLNGQFIFDNNKVVQTIPYQDVKIQITRQSTDSLISQIVITSNTGMQYTFTAGDKTAKSTRGRNTLAQYFYKREFNLYTQPVTYYNSWYLTKISSPTGGSVTFDYGTDTFTNSSPQYLQIVDSVTNVLDTLYETTYSTTSKQLQTITGSNEKATINWTGNLVSSVSITDLTYQSVSKEFVLQYHAVSGSKKVKLKKRVKRSFLSGLQEKINCNAFPGYQFNYYGINFKADSTTIPFNSGINQDLFGYYDSTATSYLPDIYVQNTDTRIDGERYRIAPYTGYSLMGSANGKRYIDSTKVYFGMLSIITLPSGGKTTITYEPADYQDALSAKTVRGGGVRVKRIKTSDNNPSADVTTSYKYTQADSKVSSGKWMYRPMFVAFSIEGKPFRVPENLAPDEVIYYSRVEVSTSGRGKSVYEFQNSGMYPTTTSSDFNASLTKITKDETCPSNGKIRSGYYAYPYAPNTNYDFERGLPTRTTDYTRDGKKVQQKTFTYQRNNNSIVPIKQISGLRYEDMSDMYLFSKYNLLANVSKVGVTTSVRSYDQADTSSVENLTTYTYSQYQMLNKVTATGSDGSSLSTQYKYAKDYAGTSSMISSLLNANRHGTMIEATSYNGSNVTASSLTLYGNYTVPLFNTQMLVPTQQFVLADPTGFFTSYENGSTFTKSGNYYPSIYFDAYDKLGHPTIIRDQSRAVKSTILGYNNSAVALDIANARYDQVAFIDFEPGNTFGQTGFNGVTTNTDKWAGQYSGAMTTSGYVFQNSIQRAPGKNYRFSCWAKANTSATLSILINGTAVKTAFYPDTVTTATGTWQYIEGIVDMDAPGVNVNVLSTFSFKLTSSAAISLDNVAFYPESASIIAHAYDPLIGKNADLDSRGISGFKEYDALGRMRYLRNTDKDIVQIKDYHYKTDNGVLPVSSFTGSTTPNTGAATTYTANPSCGSGITYVWYVNDSLTSTASSLKYTFKKNMTYYVKLVATGTYGSSSTTMTVIPIPSLNASVTSTSQADGPPPYYCTNPATFSFAVSFGTGACYDPNNVTYTWVGPNGSSVGPTFSYTPTSTAVTIYCSIASTTTNLTTGSVKPISQLINVGTFQCATPPPGTKY